MSIDNKNLGIYRNIFIYMAKTLDESWKNWATENLGLGVPCQKIFETLVNNDFELNEIESLLKDKSATNSVNKHP